MGRCTADQRQRASKGVATQRCFFVWAKALPSCLIVVYAMAWIKTLLESIFKGELAPSQSERIGSLCLLKAE
jgi:hypothetical protein